MEIETLRNKLRAAREAYYNMSPIISDSEYDALRDELTRLSPEDEEIKVVGAEPLKISVWNKHPHKYPMGSLNKVNSAEEFMQWANQLMVEHITDQFIITDKIDGSSMSLTYNGGKLERCLTRGSGTTGEDITENVIKIPNIPKEIPITHEEVTIRGEIVMLKETFAKSYAEDYANPRNTAAGKVRDKKDGGIHCRNLVFMAYTLISGSAPTTEEKRLRVLGKLGFETPEYSLGNPKQVQERFESRKLNRDSIPYEIDGMVIRVNDISIQEILGSKNLRPKGQIAYKFDPAMAVSTILDVVWATGPTGRICPVAKVKSVNIGGVNISSISLHNLAMFQELNLCRGDRVLISRKNDIIPYIEENLSSG